jgi:hypothetical protein
MFRTLAILSLLSTLLVAQNPVTNNKSQALTRMAEATGWTPLLRSGSYRVTAKLTKPDPDGGLSTSSEIVYKVSPNGYRIENVDNTTIVTSDGAELQRAGKTRFIPIHAAASMKPMVLPFMLDSLDTSQPNVTAEDDGAGTVDSQSVQKVKTENKPEAVDYKTKAIRRASPITISVTDANSMPAQIEYVKVTVNNENALVHVIRKYSDYRQVNGVMVPFHQEEWIGNEKAFDLDLVTVEFGPQLDPADFVLTTLQKGGR